MRIFTDLVVLCMPPWMHFAYKCMNFLKKFFIINCKKQWLDNYLCDRFLLLPIAHTSENFRFKLILFFCSDNFFNFSTVKTVFNENFNSFLTFKTTAWFLSFTNAIQKLTYSLANANTILIQ